MRLLPIVLSCAAVFAAAPKGKLAMSIHAFQVNTLGGQPIELATYQGKVLLVVNVASECGYTPQYAGLQKLSEAYRDKGLVVLGFPCNQFGGQEPGSAEQIQTFCMNSYGVTFPLFEKVEVKGTGKAPVYAFLTAAHGEPKWNFHKYLVGRDGKVIKAFPSSVAPDGPELMTAIEAALK